MMGEGKTHCCHHCGKLLSTSSGLHRHGNKHAALLGGSGVGGLCCRQFVDEFNLKGHKQRPTLRKHHCVVCGFSTSNLHYLKRHLKCHLGTKPYSCHICEKCFEWKGYLKVHVKTVHENMHPYSCNICNKQFKQKTSLNAHSAAQHTGEKSYSCCKCPKSFVRASSLQEHMKWHLLVKKSKQQHSCHLCDNRPFLDKTCLAVHMASAHSNSKSYMCEVCGRDFKLKNSLRAHMQTHSEERPYYCQLCDGTFKSKKDLKKHQERHKSSKDHVCETCGKSFVTKNDVYLHQKVHDPSKNHRIYKPGKYKVSGGELLTALTRSSKLSLKEQEPICFDTEINATAGSYKLKNISGDTDREAILTAGSNSVLSSLGKKAASSKSLSFETLLDRSKDSHEFQGFHALESARDATSPFLSNSSESTTHFSTKLPGRELEKHNQWNSDELLQDYGWLDASSPPDDAAAKRFSPGEEPAEQVQGYQIGGDHTSGCEAVKLQHRDDAISGIESMASSLQELPFFDDSEEAESNSDVHLQSLNEYLNDELDNSQSLTQVNLDDFSCSLHSAGESKIHDSENQSLTQVNGEDFSCSLHSAENNDTDMQGSSRDLLQVVDEASQSKDSCFGNVANCRRGQFDSMLADNNEIGFFTVTGTQVPRDSQNIVLRSEHHAQSCTPRKLGLKNRDRHLLIDFQLTSRDMFTDTSDTIKENISLPVRPDVKVSHTDGNCQKDLTFVRNGVPSSDNSHLTVVDGQLTEKETMDHLTEVDLNDHSVTIEKENHLTAVETNGYLTEVETGDHLTEVKETDNQLIEVETDDQLTELEETDNHLTEVEETDNHLTEVEETDNHLTEVEETGDLLTEVEETDNQFSEVEETDSHLTEVEETGDHLTEVEETDNHLTEVEETDNQFSEVEETDNHLTEVEESGDLLTEVEETDNQFSEVEETDNQLTEVEETDNHLTEVEETDNHFNEVETGDHLTENNISIGETQDRNKSKQKTADKQIMKDVTVEQNNIMTTSEMCREKYKLVELVSEAEEFSHGIVRSRKQRQASVPCCKCTSCSTTKGHRQPCEASSVCSPTRFKCPDCGRCYTNRSNLKTHWASIHAEAKQVFVCHLCGHVCNDKQNLGHHLVLHSSARPFRCDMCQKCFKTRASVRVHLKKHLPCMMLFRCDLCPLIYNHFNSLQSHKRTHLSAASLFTCSICGRQLSDRSNFAAHMRRHLVSRKYQCPVCEKELSSAHSLRGHQGRACLKHQIKTLKSKEKAERCLLRNRTKQQRKVSLIAKGDQ